MREEEAAAAAAAAAEIETSAATVVAVAEAEPGAGRRRKRRWMLWSPRGGRAARRERAASWWARVKFLGSAFRWKRVNIQLSFFDDVVFKLVSILEAVVLVSSLCFFYVFCGCHF
ncbi:hypothetical protein ACJRO7_017053 [Eucalyptus globulus]|uniref:Uncharacterized protein n=1 Tax=Eucalyptus globulus TaxID=34317 RepID=A0ABD3KP26_EUCGL